MLRITQGDGAVVFNFTAVSAGSTVDLTGATFSTKVKGPGGTVVTYPNSQHTANPNQTTHKGEFTLTLTQADTSAIAVGDGHEVVTKISIGGVVVYFHGRDILDVYQADPVS